MGTGLKGGHRQGRRALRTRCRRQRYGRCHADAGGGGNSRGWGNVGCSDGLRSSRRRRQRQCGRRGPAHEAWTGQHRHTAVGRLCQRPPHARRGDGHGLQSALLLRPHRVFAAANGRGGATGLGHRAAVGVDDSDDDKGVLARNKPPGPPKGSTRESNGTLTVTSAHEREHDTPPRQCSPLEQYMQSQNNHTQTHSHTHRLVQRTGSSTDWPPRR